MTVNAGQLAGPCPPEQPVLIEEDGRIRRAAEAELSGNVRICYDPSGLQNGARVWVECDSAKIVR